MTKYLDRDKLLEKLQQQKNWYNSDNSFFSDDLKVHLINSVNVIINQVNNGVFDIKANHSEIYVSWLPEEDLWCVTRFIEHYFERLIKFGRTINSKEMALELKLYQEHFANNRKENSVILKFRNVEHLGFNLIIEYGNPYNIKIKKGMTAKTKQLVKAWTQQTTIYVEKINGWFNIS